jgi:hypothetical protein
VLREIVSQVRPDRRLRLRLIDCPAHVQRRSVDPASVPFQSAVSMRFASLVTFFRGQAAPASMVRVLSVVVGAGSIAAAGGWRADDADDAALGSGSDRRDSELPR